MDRSGYPGEEAWDEFRWESFLNEQDVRTEQYLYLLDQYMDHPDRDRIIADEMGWEAYESLWDDLPEIPEDGEIPFEEMGEEEFEDFVTSPAYEETMALHTWIHEWVAENEERQAHPTVMELATRCALCGAKLAAALCGTEDDEPGMTVAYLKRALKAANDSLECASDLARGKMLIGTDFSEFWDLIFRVRNRIVDLMGHYRAEWRRKTGQG